MRVVSVRPSFDVTLSFMLTLALLYDRGAFRKFLCCQENLVVRGFLDSPYPPACVFSFSYRFRVGERCSFHTPLLFILFFFWGCCGGWLCLVFRLFVRKIQQRLMNANAGKWATASSNFAISRPTWLVSHMKIGTIWTGYCFCGSDRRTGVQGLGLPPVIRA